MEQALAAPASGNAAGDFFTHHGVWAPGVRLFRRIGFKAKAVILSAVFLLPTLVLGLSFYGDKADAIAFSAKEKLGVDYARELMPLLHDLQRWRVQAVGGAAAPGLPERIDAQLKKVAAVDARLGAELGTSALHVKLTQSVAALATRPADAQAAFEARTRVVDAALELLGQSTDGSNLILDPDLDSYYLMDLSTTRIPQAMDLLGRMHAAGTTVLVGGAAVATQAAALREAAPLLDYHESQAKVAVAKVRQASPAVAAGLSAEASPTAAAAFAAMTRAAFFAADGAKPDRSAFDAAAAKAIDEQHALAGRTLDALEQLLDKRLAGFSGLRNAVSVVVALALACAAYLFCAFFFVTRGGLLETRRHLEAMTLGDLTTQPRPWGRDEAAELLIALGRMQVSLRGIVSRVRVASGSIVQASGEIAAASTDLSSRTEQAAANLERSASSMEQISATVRSTAGNVQEAARIAAANSEAATRGGRVIAEVVATMQGIQNASGRIGEIIGTIDSIAFQTNILALNAAVEAARAGEQGRGFAVVASEVRQLAQRSADAAREIKTLIAASGERVASGTRVVEGAGVTMEELVVNAQRMNALLVSVASAASEQSDGVAQVGTAVQDLDRMTQQNAALVEETAASASSLKAQALELANQVATFRLPPH